MKQLIETIEKLRLRNIGFRSLTESIDTTMAQGVLIFHMFSALAEFERALIRERTRAGLKSAKLMGRAGGRPPKLTEDDLDIARTLLANPTSPLPTLPTVSAYRLQRCIDICLPRAQRIRGTNKSAG
jgi:DNA invertase Pin-like site-specific DNA recombinase